MDTIMLLVFLFFVFFYRPSPFPLVCNYVRLIIFNIINYQSVEIK